MLCWEKSSTFCVQGIDIAPVGDEIILTIRSSEIENLQKEDDNKTKIAVEQLQLGTQRIK